MADLSRSELQRLARLGAQARIDELQQEIDSIRRAFPDVGSRRSGRQKGADGARRRSRRRMSAAARRAVSERMTKYWADRRKAKAKAAK